MLPIKSEVWARPLIRKPKPCLDVHRQKIDDKNAAVDIVITALSDENIVFCCIADEAISDSLLSIDLLPYNYMLATIAKLLRRLNDMH